MENLRNYMENNGVHFLGLVQAGWKRAGILWITMSDEIFVIA
jgi:hypothetical protein